MSYARKGLDGSAVYVYATGDEWICHECSISGGANAHEATPGGMLAHLAAHARQGEHVPAAALDRLAREEVEAAERAVVLDRLRAAAEGAEPIGWAGPEREIACLREMLETEEDPAVRARMQRRLDEVLALGNDADPTRGDG